MTEAECISPTRSGVEQLLTDRVIKALDGQYIAGQAWLAFWEKTQIAFPRDPAEFEEAKNLFLDCFSRARKEFYGVTANPHG